MLNVLILYDVTSDKIRNRLHKLLEDYGIWVQFSKYELCITDKEFQRMIHQIKQLINPNQDSIRVYQLCQACMKKIMIIGKDKKISSSNIF